MTISTEISALEVGASPGNQLAARLTAAWCRALAGERDAQQEWQIADHEGGKWEWRDGGVHLQSTGPDWPSLMWRGWQDIRRNDQTRLVIKIKVSGQADAAGFSFGPYKDFLAPLAGPHIARHLCLELDGGAQSWAFSVDGRLVQRQWWDAAVQGIDDLFGGTLSLKAKRPREVLFQNLTVETLEDSCRLSVIMTCHRFLQRLRISLRNWCHQSLPPGSYEILVVNPQSPDGTHEHLAAVARSFPHLRLREIEVERKLVANKGAMINQAVEASRGHWIWLTDADCLFSPDSAANILNRIDKQKDHLHYGARFRLTPTQTDALLAGRVDSLRDFAELRAAATESDCAPWGYTQIVHRTVFHRTRYPEKFNHFAHSDGAFVEACKRRNIWPREVEGLFCLHLDHPFAWYGTDTFL